MNHRDPVFFTVANSLFAFATGLQPNSTDSEADTAVITCSVILGGTTTLTALGTVLD